MKKTVTAFLSVLCVGLFCSIVLTGCNINTPESEHTHTYPTEWSFDNTYHWHNCTDENCSAISDKTKHIFEDGICECGYKNTDSTSTIVTKDEFKSAITGLTNFTVSCIEKTPTWDEKFETITGSKTFESIMYVTENAIKLTANKEAKDALNGDYFVEFDGEQVYVYIPTDPIMKVSINSEDVFTGEEAALDVLNSVESIKTMLGLIDFDNFTYIDGAYVGTIPADIDNPDTTIPATLKFENKKLVYVYIDDSSYYELENGSSYCRYEFSDHNATTVTLPTDYIDYSNTENTQWANYFTFDNVTIDLLTTTTMTVDGQISSLSENKKLLIQGKKWLLTTPDYDTEYQLYDKIIYFDGTNTYVDGELEENGSSSFEKDVFLSLINYLAFCGNEFTETSSGVWETSKMDVSSANENGEVSKSMTLNDVKITVQNNTIAAVSFSVFYDLSEYDLGTSTVSYIYTFTNYGTTGINYTVNKPSEQS